jgi:UDP-N-acetylmuramoyl-L-alanyl-D-glutamate--2,6-diaminopimelate ligase
MSMHEAGPRNRSKKLHQIILGAPAGFDPEIRGLQYDSRKVLPGDLFFAVPGFLEDGVKYLAQAFEKGAAAAVVREGTVPPPAYADRCVTAFDIRVAMADAACRFYDHPARRLKMLGITGTKGKTSTAYLLESIYKAAGKVTAVLGTVECRHPGRSYPSHHTTLEAIDLQRFLSEALEHKVTHVIMEVSSHALSLNRVYGVAFDGMIFTNLSPDHMDFYVHLEPYYQAKRMLFQPPFRKASAIAVANADSEFGERVIKECPGKWASFGRAKGEFRIEEAKADDKGAFVRLRTPNDGSIDLDSQMGGDFSFLNIAAAASLALSDGIPAQAVKKGIAELPGVPGRLERVPTSLPISVFVDFAHTGLALENVLRALRPVTRGRLFVLFGAGGDKDPARRTTQGRISAELADFSVITSDNPRTEDPLKIIRAIEEAHRAAGGKAFVVEPDRKKAIRIALEMAKPGDVFCLAGKGHETGQIVGDQVFPFDDRVEAGLVLRELEAKGLA